MSLNTIVNKIQKDFESLWKIEFTSTNEEDFVTIKPKKEEYTKKFPLTVGIVQLSQFDLTDIIQPQNANILVYIWESIHEINKKKTPVPLFIINDEIFLIIKFTNDYTFYDDFTITDNNIVITYQLSKVPRVKETLIILRWKDFLTINNTSDKRRYIKEYYK